MDKQETLSTTSGNTIVKHIFKFDDETKTTLMNLTQYIVLAVIPVAILQHLSDKIFPEHDISKGTIELLAEILGQSITTIIGLFFIHRVITAAPTFSGTAMGDINLFSIIIVFLLTSFMFNSKTQEKFKEISKRLLDIWDGTSEETKSKISNQQENKVNNRVSVSQPISRGGMPTHSPSRADYLNSPNAQMSPSQMIPPVQQEPQQPQQQPPQQQQLATQGNMQESYSNLPSEPAAYNSGGGFAPF